MTTRTISRLNAVDRLQRFKQAVKNAPGNHYFNIIVAQVDPDALGSAFAVAEILRALDKNTAIWYSGGISHPQNKVLRNRFNLGAEIQHISKFSPLTDPETGEWSLENNLVLVDSCLGNDSRLRVQMHPWIVVDHHRHSDLVEAPQFTEEADGFLWLDESAGSACTLATELLQHAIQDGVMDPGWVVPESVATLAAMGIYTDTTNLVSAGKRDREAYGWLQQYTNDSTISDIIDYPLEEANFNHMYRAFDPTNRKQHNAHLLSGLGLIDSEYADDLSTVCNMFLRKPGVEIAITWAGVVFTDEDSGEETVKLRVCARSRSLVIDLAEFLRKRFKGKCGAKQLPNGRGEGGALFELDFDGWMQRTELLEIVGRRLKEWLFDEETPQE